MSDTASTRPSALTHPFDVPEWPIRKVVVQVEEVLHEGGRGLDSPVKKLVAAAVLHNRWADQSHQSDLTVPVQRIAPVLAKILTDRILDCLDTSESVVAFGKGALVGHGGEAEHGAALIHTPYFANLVREYLDGDKVIAFADDRADAGASLLIPMCRTRSGPTRDYFQTATSRIADAPRRDEIVIAVAASTGTRPFARVGDRTTDPNVSTETMKGIL